MGRQCSPNHGSPILRSGQPKLNIEVIKGIKSPAFLSPYFLGDLFQPDKLEKAFLLSHTTLLSINSSTALAFLVLSLQMRTAALYSPFETRPCFQRLCTFSFCPSSRCPLFSQASCPTCSACGTVALPAPRLLKGVS